MWHNICLIMTGSQDARDLLEDEDWLQRCEEYGPGFFDFAAFEAQPQQTSAPLATVQEQRHIDIDEWLAKEQTMSPPQQQPAPFSALVVSTGTPQPPSQTAIGATDQQVGAVGEIGDSPITSAAGTSSASSGSGRSRLSSRQPEKRQLIQQQPLPSPPMAGAPASSTGAQQPDWRVSVSAEHRNHVVRRM